MKMKDDKYDKMQFKREETRKILRESKDPEIANKLLQKMGIDTVYLAQFQSLAIQKIMDCKAKREEAAFPEILLLPGKERQQWLIDHKVYSSIVRSIRLNLQGATRFIYVLYCPKQVGIDREIKSCWYFDVKVISNPVKSPDKILLGVEEQAVPFPDWIKLK